MQLKDWIELVSFVLALVFQSGVLIGVVKMSMKSTQQQLASHHKRLGAHSLRIGMLELKNAQHFPNDPITLPPEGLHP